MRACVFVDGENFIRNIRNVVADLLVARNLESQSSQEKYLLQNANWGGLFDHFVDESLSGAKRLRTYWYSMDTVDMRPYLLGADKDPEKWKNENWRHMQKSVMAHDADPRNADSKLSELNAADLVRTLQERRHTVEQGRAARRSNERRITNVHKAVEFRYSGEISYNLVKKEYGREKTVDVNLSVDMLQMRDNYDMAVIVSGDQDYLPAVQAVKNEGKTVVNVSFVKNSGEVSPSTARRLNECTDWSVEVAYHTLAKFLGLKIPAPRGGA